MKIFTSTNDFIKFLEPTKDWLKCNGELNNKLFWTDHLYLSKFGNKKFASSIFALLHQYKIVSTYRKLVLVSSVVCKSFVLSQRVCEVDPPCYVTVVVSTVKNGKHSSSCYHVTSVTDVKVCNFFVSSQSVCEAIPIHDDVVHVTTDATVKHWNEISLCRPRILPAPVTHVENVSTYVNKYREGDWPRITSFDASSAPDPDPIDVLKSYDEIEGSTLFRLPMLKINVVVFVSFLFMTFVFNFRMIFIFCPIFTFRFSLFIVNSILTFYRCCYCFIYTVVLTNLLPDVPSKLRSCFYVFQKMFLTFSFSHPTENLIQCPFLWIMVLLFNFKMQLRF